MDFERQKPVSEAYRQGWRGIWETDAALPYRLAVEAVLHETNPCVLQYTNGCPIIEERDNA